ncbi:GspH/FimT family pseudopilin [Silanimonas lenta]|uniref:GspH/FimT family pseudopilin n=1 Tax=Silanimonas lenta TaxID=265429 RepID=UPI002FE3E6D9
MLTASRGHGLIELVAATTILSIIAAIAAPDLQAFVRSRQAIAVAGNFHTELNLARHTAIVRGHRAVLCRSLDGTGCAPAGAWSDGFMSFIDLNGNNLREVGEPLLRYTTGVGSKGVKLHINEGRRHVAFRPDGRGGGTNLTAVVCDAEGHAHRTVVVSVAGRVRMGMPGPSTRCP